MFGPVWMWIAGAGWTAKTVVDKLRQPGAPPQPGAAPAAARTSPATPGAPPAVVERPEAMWDKNMDLKTEAAVRRALQMGDPAQLRAFAASIDENIDRRAAETGIDREWARRRYRHPIAAYVMRANAAHIEQQRREAAAAKPAPAASPVEPAKAAPAPHANGAAAPATAAAVVAEVTATPES